MKKITMYQSEDGKVFQREEQCAEYERVFGITKENPQGKQPSVIVEKVGVDDPEHGLTEEQLAEIMRPTEEAIALLEEMVKEESDGEDTPGERS